jgi:protein phosphatase
MGTTLTLGIFGDDGVLRMAHVGDSRAYLLRDGELRMLTQDHTVVAELIAMGHLPEEAAEDHPQRHLLTRTLGLGPVDVDTFDVDLSVGDRVLFCSDGLTTMLGDGEIETIVSADGGVEAAVWSLIEAANSSGGIDNTTVAVVDVKR